MKKRTNFQKKKTMATISESVMAGTFSGPADLQDVKISREVHAIERITKRMKENPEYHLEFPIGETSDKNDFVKVTINDNGNMIDVIGHVSFDQDEPNPTNTPYGNYMSTAAILRYLVESLGYSIEVRKMLVNNCVKYVTFVTWK